MRKLLSSLICCSIVFASAAIRADYFAYPFIGKWNNSDAPITLEQYDYQDIQNLRPDGKRLKGVRGHTKINTSVWDSTYSYPLNGYHFRKTFPAESHVIIQTTDSSSAASYLYENTTAIPDQGGFEASTLYTESSGFGKGVFSGGPQGFVLYDNGVDSLLWGGNESLPIAFITSTAAIVDSITNPSDYTEAVRNNTNSAEMSAVIGGGLNSNTKLLLHFNGADAGTTITDSGDTGHSPSAVGNMQLDTAYKVFGTASGLFDGNGDYVTVADHADWDFSTNAVTLDGRVRFNAVTGQYSLYFQGTGTSYVDLVYDGHNDKMHFIVSSAGTQLIHLSGTWTPSTDTWYHWAVIRGWGGVANDWAITIDGTAIATATASITMPNIAAALAIGTQSLTVPVDYGTTGHAFTLYDNAIITQGAGKYGDGGFSLDGTADGAAAADSTDWDILTQTNATISLWVKHTDHAGTEFYVSQREDGNNFWALYHIHGSGLIFSANSGGVQVVVLSGGEITDTDPHHVLLVKKGDDYGLYLDGTQTAFVNDASTDTFAGSLWIGRDDTGTYPFAGVIDELQITHTNLYNASPVVGLSDTITPPSDHEGLTANSKLLLYFDTGYFNGWMDEYRVLNGQTGWIETFTPLTRAYRTDALNWLVGYHQPLQGVKYYVRKANPTASTLTATEWQTGGWNSLTITDNTDTGASLAQTGTVTWTATGNAKRRWLNGYDLYWYNFTLDAGDAEIYEVTVDAPMADVPNIWSGEGTPVTECIHWDSALGSYSDCTDIIQSEVTTDVLVLDSAPNTDYLLVGFTQPMQTIEISIPASKGNANVAALTLQYGSGDGWTTVANMSDGTTYFRNTGYLYFIPPLQEEEFTQSINNGIPLYWYKISWAATLDAETEIYNIKGFENPPALKKYRFPGFYQNRAFQFSEVDGVKNRAIYSAFNAPYIWNGSDTGYLTFGSEKDTLTAAVVVYNVFLSDGYEQLIVTSKNSTYRVYGNGPDNWDIDQISGDIGCNAPLSMVACGAADMGDGNLKHVAVWQSSSGVVMSDGAKIINISDDIRAYWDPNNSLYIPVDRQDDSFGWYDADLGVYKLLISSGSGQTTHNVELEYNLALRQWTKLYRENGTGANPLQIAFPVSDTSGNQYSFGATNEGTMYRLENGSDWAGAADIDQYVWTKDLLLNEQTPFFTDTEINWLRLMYADRSTSDTISLSHYCNGSATTSGVNEQSLPSGADVPNINAGPIYTADVTLGPCHYHSLKIECDTNATDGLELNGLGFVFDSYVGDITR